MVPFTPRLIPTILPNLAHHVASIQSAAQQTNQNLFEVIQNLPPPQSPAPTMVASSASSTRALPTSPLPPAPETPATIRTSVREAPPADIMSLSDAMRIATDTDRTPAGGRKSRASTISGEAGGDVTLSDATRGQSPSPAGAGVPGTVSNLASLWQSQPQLSSPTGSQQPQLQPLQPQPVEPAVSMAVPEEPDPFDYQATVTGLTVQFLSEYEETRVAALKWLIMLHSKAPRKAGISPSLRPHQCVN
jgi:vacuole morphology and inheritance protein 14